mgnify:FL=1
MLSLQEIIEKLKILSCLELQEMAHSIDVSYDTLISIRIGRASNPRLNTLIAISGCLKDESQRSN